MTITAQVVANQLGAYLQGQVPLADLVDWAERQILDSDFESKAVRDAVARLGVADVRAFGLTWEECRRLLDELGFSAHVNIATV